MKTRHTKLKMKLVETGITQYELCEKINRSSAYISDRMNFKHPFDVNDVYAICDALSIPYNKIHEYFPKE